MPVKNRAPRNRTVTLDGDDVRTYSSRLLRLEGPTTSTDLLDRTICQDVIDAARHLPDQFVDLLIADPPYNLDKSFNGKGFKSRSSGEYAMWLEAWLVALRRTLKSTASIYICSDWRAAAAVQQVAERHFVVQNRITWEREKGRGALRNWKNCSEDIWFLTVSREFTFNVEAVMLKRRVIAPYKDAFGKPKDWEATERGNFRLTHPSNLWTDLSVPFWSMPENTDHPTQKPEKLIAKLVLASSCSGEVVLDPFLGSGTTSVVARKLGRRFVGIEIDQHFCCLAEKRLAAAAYDPSIQGYHDGVFWERNTLADQRLANRRAKDRNGRLFDAEGIQ